MVANVRAGGDPAVVAAWVTVVAGTVAFLALTVAVHAGLTQHWDERVLLWLRNPDDLAVPAGPAWGQEVGRDLTALGGVAFLSLATAAVTGFLLLSGKRRAAALLLAAVLGGQLLSTLLKVTIDRERPSVVPHLARVATSSFPSGHSMLSAVVYLTLGSLLARLVAPPRLKLYCVAVAMLLTLLVGLSRAYLGVHYPSDVLAGWSAGLAWAAACWLLARRLQHGHAVEGAFTPGGADEDPT